MMLLQPSTTRPTDEDDADTFVPASSVCSIAIIEDTVELIVEGSESKAAAPLKVNKWHEKFAKGRATKPKE